MDGKTVVIVATVMLAVFASLQYFLEKRRDENINVVRERLNLLEDKNKWLEAQLEDARADSPDEIAEALHKRVGILKSELTDLRKDNAAHGEQIKVKEEELNQVRAQIMELGEQIERANVVLEEYKYFKDAFSCPQCGAELINLDDEYHNSYKMIQSFQNSMTIDSRSDNLRVILIGGAVQNQKQKWLAN